MRFERKVVDASRGIVQVTLEDERWYLISDAYFPSVTWICHYYPKGKGFETWLAKNGVDEAEAIKQAAADKGSKVHHAIVDIINGKTVRFDSRYINPSTGQSEELTAEEYSCVMSFVEWADENKVKFLKQDFVVVNTEVGYAGTVDFTCQIGDKFYLVDIKTSQSVYPSHEIQVAAYINADDDLKDYSGAILQVGYRKNKKSYKFTEIGEDKPLTGLLSKFNLFLSVRDIWANECSNIKPLQRDYPLELKLGR